MFKQYKYETTDFNHSSVKSIGYLKVSDHQFKQMYMELVWWNLFSWNVCSSMHLYLHLAPFLSLQLAVQQGSSLRWRSPGSQSSSSSTREFPHSLVLLSLKHWWAFNFKVLLTEDLLQLEKCCEKKQLYQAYSNGLVHEYIPKAWRCLVSTHHIICLIF